MYFLLKLYIINFILKKERIEPLIKKTKENELKFKINQFEIVNKVVNEKFAESMKKFSDTEKEY
jgi:hypothetical protein